MEERQRREEEQRVREERARIREEKKLVRSSLGSAMDQQISTNEEAVSSSFVSEYESPEIAAKRRKKHNSSVSRNVMNVNVLSVLKLNVKALKIKISMRYLKNIPKIHITWQNVA